MEKYAVAKKYLQTGNTFRITAKGTSMLPFYKSEVELLIKAIPLQIGYCVLAVSETLGCRVHRIIGLDSNGYYCLKGDGLLRCETEVIDEKNVIGVVVGFYKKGQLYKYKTGKYSYGQIMLFIAKLSMVYDKINAKIFEKNIKSIKIKRMIFVYHRVYLFIIYIFSVMVNNLLVYKPKDGDYI